MPMDLAQSARGAAAGAVAAGVWAAQQPLDVRVFGVDYRDTELLGKTLTRGPGWRVAGVALHLLTGAAFGAGYAAVAPRVPLPSWVRGPAAGIGEHLGTWPLMALAERAHPAPEAVPPGMAGSARAFAQSLWRHLLFGVVLGELERRLNRPPEAELVPVDETTASTNGHGDLERALMADRG